MVNNFLGNSQFHALTFKIFQFYYYNVCIKHFQLGTFEKHYKQKVDSIAKLLFYQHSSSHKHSI